MRTLGLLLDRAYVLLVDLEVHRDSGGFDGNTPLDLIGSRVGSSHLSRTFFCDDSRL